VFKKVYKEMTRARKTKKTDITEIVTAVKIVKLNPKLLGALFLSFGLVVLLSIISYDRTDINTLSSLTELLNPNQKSNWLGIVGANIAHTFFMYTFGFASVIFPVWFVYIGLQLLKQKERNIFYHKNLLILLNISFFISMLLAFPESYRTVGKTVDYYPSGLIGGLAMDMILRMFGKTGSIIILMCYFLSMIFIYLPKGIFLKFWIAVKSKIKLPILVLDREKTIDSEIDGTIETDDDIEAVETINEEQKKNDIIPYREVNYDQKKEVFETSKTEVIKPEKEEKDINDFQKDLYEEMTEEKIKKDDEINEKFALKNELPEKNNDFLLTKEELNIDENLKRIDSQEAIEEDSELNHLIDEIQIIKPKVINKKTIESETFPKVDEEHHPEFSIEEEIHEKESNLDKIQKKLSKRERYNYPSVDLLDSAEEGLVQVSEEELWASAKLLEDKLTDFKVEAKVVNVICGPVITMYELRPAQGVRLGKIESLMDDIALNMSARGIRYLGQLPGKDTLGIEVPNAKPNMVYFKDIINSEKFVKSKFELPVALGKAVNGEIVIWDLADMPHLLVAGATGAGKSVGINSLIASLLYRKHPDDLKFVMIDPKMLELGLYNDLVNHHLAYSRI
jgi:DNA segregation ATPase FtsK/SpoIIIE, S-DNA-T family